MAIFVVFLMLMAGCSSSKLIPEEEYLLEKVQVKTDDKHLDVGYLEPYIRQKANSRWFSLFKVPLATYAAAGTDTTRWINRTLRRIGEEPVIYDSVQARLSCQDLLSAMHNLGYMNASVDLKTKTKGKKLKAIYTLNPGIPFFIHSVRYDVQDSTIRKMLRLDLPENQQLKEGTRFTVDKLDAERKRITSILLDSGYYRFNKDFIQFSADSTKGNHDVDIVLHLLRYRANDEMPETNHPRYTIAKINYLSGDTTGIPLREKVLENNTMLEEGKPFSQTALQKTYNRFARLQAIRYTSIHFREHPDTTLLDCNIQISTNKSQTIAFQPEGTNTAGDLGAAATLTYENRNLLKGGETFSVGLRAAFEAITGLEGYQNEDYEEYSIETKLGFPRFVAPFLSRSFIRRSTAVTELSLSWNMQNRPEFHRRVFTAAWRYRWSNPQRHTSYRLDLPEINYVYMPWISETFKHDYLDSVSNRNAILRYNYEDLFIMRIGFSMLYSNNGNVIRANVETAGNVLNAASHAFGMHKNDNDQYTLFNIAFAQYAKFDFDFSKLIQFDTHNALALHAALGVAWPYGNSSILPFEKRYFSGGANSVRGWNVRELGPGRFKGSGGKIDFINQTGDMKLDLSAELRSFLFWKIDGAVFIDAGNIWTLRNYAEQEGGQFKFSEFYKQIAVAYGLGLRLNFDYFIIRFDAGMKAINPAYSNSREHYPILHHKFSRDFSFHFAVGLPF